MNGGEGGGSLVSRGGGGVGCLAICGMERISEILYYV